MSTEKKQQNIVLTFNLEEMKKLVGLPKLNPDQKDDLDVCATQIVRHLRLFKEHLHKDSDKEESDDEEEETKHEVSEESGSESESSDDEEEEEEYWECCGRDHGLEERCATCERWLCKCDDVHRKAETCRKCKVVRPKLRT